MRRACELLIGNGLMLSLKLLSSEEPTVIIPFSQICTYINWDWFETCSEKKITVYYTQGISRFSTFCCLLSPLASFAVKTRIKGLYGNTGNTHSLYTLSVTWQQTLHQSQFCIEWKFLHVAPWICYWCLQNKALCWWEWHLNRCLSWLYLQWFLHL